MGGEEEVKKILGLTIAVVLVIGLVAGGTWAFFSDTEEITGITLSAGTIDLAVNGENPWTTDSITAELTDLKPCDVAWVTITLTNVGDNEMDVWKHIEVTDTTGGDANYPVGAEVASSEPEWQECGGASYVEECDIDGVIRYDLTVGGTPKIVEGDDYTISDGTHHLAGATDSVACEWIYLGTIAPGGEMVVEQSYHMDADTENWAQGDCMIFSIHFFAQQTVGFPPPPSPEHPNFQKP